MIPEGIMTSYDISNLESRYHEILLTGSNDDNFVLMRKKSEKKPTHLFFEPD